MCLSEVWSVRLLPLRVLLGLFWFGALATVVSAERNPGAEVHISTKWNQCQSSFGIPWGPLVLPCLCSDLSDASASFQSKGSCSQHSQSASRPFLQSFPLYLLVPWSMENEDLYLELCTLPNSFHVPPPPLHSAEAPSLIRPGMEREGVAWERDSTFSGVTIYKSLLLLLLFIFVFIHFLKKVTYSSVQSLVHSFISFNESIQCTCHVYRCI